MEDNKRTEISELGEFGLIDRISSTTNIRNKSTQLGIGDDCAIIGEGEELTLLSTDMLLEGVHFDLSFTPLQHLGYKAIAVNVSDIAAMNGIPQQVTVGLGLSNRISVEAVDEIYKGIAIACEEYGVDLVGGDTTSSMSGLVISISVVGTAHKGKIVKRNGAKEDDAIVCSGDLGGAYVGLQVLLREKEVFITDPDMQPKLDKFQYVVQRQLRPKARMDIIHELRGVGVVPTSMIDISDGLASELMHLCTRSEVGAQVFEENIPIEEETYHAGLEFNLGPETSTLNGGEDYELLFTIPKADLELIKNIPDLTVIGHVTEKAEGIKYVSKSGNVHDIKAQGWKHF